MSHTYFLDPLDVLLFRDGRPRVTGDSHVMKGSFPPPPSALYGAFRSAVLAAAGARFKPSAVQSAFEGLSADVALAVGTPAHTGTLTLRHVLLAHRSGDAVTPLFHPGLDLVRPKEEARNGERFLLRPVADGAVTTSLPEGIQRLAAPPDAGFVEPLRGWLDVASFGAYLRGELEGLTLHEPTSPFTHKARATDSAPSPFGTESRTSLMIDDQTGTASDGMLFTTDFTRLQARYGFYVAVENAPGLGDEGLLRLGAEQRPVAYTSSRAALPGFDGVAGRIRSRFRLVLASPAPFDAGWRPDFVGADLTGSIGGCRVRLVAAAVGRYEHIGGWELARARPRPARRAAPAGSVYYFDIISGDAASLAAAHGTSLFSPDDDRARHGLGLAFIGA